MRTTKKGPKKARAREKAMRTEESDDEMTGANEITDADQCGQ